jgi:flagellar hook-associated protein 1
LERLMPDLFAALRTSANALSVFEKSLDVTQNNVTNASTPGYAKQRMSFVPLPEGLGGVRTGLIESSRDRFAEAAVRQQTSVSGSLTQQSTDLSQIAAVFDVTGNSGIPAALSKFYQSLSAFALTPSSSVVRQQVLSAAQDLAVSFNQTSQNLSTVSNSVDQQIKDTTTQINDLASSIAELNKLRKPGPSQDPATDAQIHDKLEQLSGLANIQVLYPDDGTVTVLLGGQTPLVIGNRSYGVQASFYTDATPAPVNPNAPPTAHLLDTNGQDVTGQITSGQLGGLLSERNGLLASLRGDSQQVGDVNRLAQQIADRVNQLLTQGQITDNPATPGVPLFTFMSSNPTAAAGTMTLTNITSDQLAAIDPGPPPVSNGIALKLSGLVNSTDPADQIDGVSYVSFYSGTAAKVGTALQNVQNAAGLQQQLVAQAKSLRNDLSGVSLDEEAVRLVELQKSYGAVAKFVTVINQMTDTLVNMLG